MPRRKDNWLGDLPPGQFPHANSETLKQVPDRCPRCTSYGPWHAVDEGVSCIICGLRWRVAEVLREMVGRQYREDNRPDARRRN